MNCSTLSRRLWPWPSFRSLYAFVGLLACGLPAAAKGATLPASVVPPAPFPLVLASSSDREAVAPGVLRGTYRLLTSSGPLVVSIVAVDPKEPTVRLGTVLAHESIVSKGEPVSSMARRTGAVAGINGDYFDINGTGAPVGVLVRNGVLDRTPSGRVALTVTRDREVRFETYRFAGTVSSGVVNVPLTAVNEWPPRTGAVLLTPAFGAPPPAQSVTVLELAPMANDGSGVRYRVASVTPSPPYPPTPALRLALGPAAQAFGAPPDVGDVVTLTYDTDPALETVAAAIGGGPALLRDSAPVDDPSSPNYADRDKRIPASAAARLPDGTLALVVVDGRHPSTSIGVNRAELIALLRGLGATDAMLFDSGGSATLVARVLGDAQPTVVNEPSDGIERPVADGLFVYSDAPVGPPAQLVVRPSRIVALPGARVPLRTRIVDANGHGLGDARGAWRLDAPPQIAAIGDDDVLRVGTRTGVSTLHVARAGVVTDVPLEIVDHVTRLVIGPARANPDPHTTVMLTVAAFDAHDHPVAIDGLARWSARDGTIDARGRLTAGERNATVTVNAGGANATVTIPVGRSTVPLALFDDGHRAAWKLTTVPANGSGSLAFDGDRLRLGYDFTTGGRAAYAIGEIPIGEPVGLACAIDADGNGEALRATLVDRYGDRESVTFARALDFSGTRRLSVKVPPSLAPPLTLRSFYVVGTLANPPIQASGTVRVHECTATLPGTQAP